MTLSILPLPILTKQRERMTLTILIKEIFIVTGEKLAIVLSIPHQYIYIEKKIYHTHISELGVKLK